MVRLWAMAAVLVVNAAGVASADQKPPAATLGSDRGARLETIAMTGKARPQLMARRPGLQLDLADARALARPVVRGSAPKSGRTAVASLVAPRGRAISTGRGAAVRAVIGRSRSRSSGPTMRANALAAAPFAVPFGQLAWLDLSGDKEPVAVPVTDRLSFGVGYRFVNGEDLASAGEQAGSIAPDYASHHVLLRAHWEF